MAATGWHVALVAAEVHDAVAPLVAAAAEPDADAAAAVAAASAPQGLGQRLLGGLRIS
jgi:hypothetical protein